MTNLENHLFRKFKLCNERLLEAMGNRDLKKAHEWQIRGAVIFDIFKDVTTQPILRAKIKSDEVEKYAN